MAEGKKSFVLYADLIDNIDHLTNEEKGILFTHLLEYVNDEEPVLEDRLILTAWKPIERQLKRDLKKYEVKKDERSKSGHLGNLKKYNSDLYEAVVSEKITLKQAITIAKNRKASHSDTKLAVNVNDNDNVNDNVSDNDILYNVDDLKEKYLKDDILIKAVISNKDNKLKSKDHLITQLDKFNKHLTENGSHAKKWNDYTSHFRHWNKKNITSRDTNKPTSNLAF